MTDKRIVAIVRLGFKTVLFTISQFHVFYWIRGENLWSNFPMYFHVLFVGICLGPRREYFACLVKELVDEKMQLFVSGDNQQYWYVKLLTLPCNISMKIDRKLWKFWEQLLLLTIQQNKTKVRKKKRKYCLI